jgi:hypothetical protein
MKLVLTMVTLMSLTGCTANIGNSPWDPRLSDCKSACEVCDACRNCETCQVKPFLKKK